MNLHLAQQSGPTYIDLDVIAWIINGVIEREHHYSETGEDIDADMLRDRGCGYPSSACAQLWVEFETALHAALTDYFIAHSPYDGREKAESDANEFMCADGPYAVFMQLSGEGVGTQDSWVDTHALVTSADCDAMFSYIAPRLARFADVGGGGSLNEAHEICAYH